MCGFDGALGRYPVGIEAAHVRWHSRQCPDELANALALCALEHALFDLGVLGIIEDRRIRVSSPVRRQERGRDGSGCPRRKPLNIPRPHQPTVDVIHISWHDNQVFKELCEIDASFGLTDAASATRLGSALGWYETSSRSISGMWSWGGLGSVARLEDLPRGIEAIGSGDPFGERPLLIAHLDHASRNEALRRLPAVCGRAMA